MFSVEFYVQIALYLLTIGVVYGGIKTDLTHMKNDIAELKELNLSALKQEVHDLRKNVERLEREIHDY